MAGDFKFGFGLKFRYQIVCNVSLRQSENWVKKMQAAAYNGARTVYDMWQFCHFLILSY